jgi:maltose alpha-D-glucosyltransferase / alpha-amylase
MLFRSTSRYAELVGPEPDRLSVHALGLEQSNTSVILGNRLMFKAYRRLQEGINPELEIGRFLTETSPFDRIAAVAGYLEYHGTNGIIKTLGILQGYVANQGDGWSYTLGYLEKYLEEKRLETREQRSLEEEASQAIYVTMMHRLGQRTGELHRALAKRTDETAFDPEPATASDLREWWERVRRDIGLTLDRLAQHQERVPESAHADVLELLASRDKLSTRFVADAPPGLQILKTRHHGDYHLGQVLVVENDFIIIDFEGEPARSLDERRAKHSPLRDVAGMLRSFNYAAYTALNRITVERPDDFAKIEPAARAWEQRVTEVFLRGYVEAIHDCGVYPIEAEHARGLLRLFSLEKALYELRYELDNRPDWVSIPIRGILDLMKKEETHDETNKPKNV